MRKRARLISFYVPLLLSLWLFGACSDGNEPAGLSGGKKEPAQCGIFDRILGRIILNANTAGCYLGLSGRCTALGYAYELGRVVPRDYPEAARLYRQGCGDTQNVKCPAYEHLCERVQANTTDNATEAKNGPVFYAACQLGCNQGCVRWGSFLENASGVKRDFATARRLYQKTCEDGFGPGCTALARFYDRGYGLHRDWDMAQRLYQKACEAEDMAGCAELGDFFLENERDKAESLFKKACDAENALGCYYLAALYRDVTMSRHHRSKPVAAAVPNEPSSTEARPGKLLELSDDKLSRKRHAKDLDQQACNLGEKRGCLSLSSRSAPDPWSYDGCHGEVCGLMGDRDEPIDIHNLLSQRKKNCEDGNLGSCVEYGIMNLSGAGGSPDVDEAARVFKKACDWGNEDACIQLHGFFP